MSDESTKGARTTSGRPSASSQRLKPGAVYCEIDAAPQQVMLEDVNAAGVFVPSENPPAADSEVDVVLQIGELLLHVGGHVVQVVSAQRAKQERKRQGFGLLFTNMQESERAALRREIDAAHVVRRNESERAAARRAEERALLDKLQAQLRELPSAPWQVLGITHDADFETAQRAFFAASKRYHPHLFSRYEMPEIKRTVTELFIAHKRAFSVLEKGLERAARANTPAAGTSQPAVAHPSSPRNPARTTGSSLRPEAALSPTAELERSLSAAMKSLAQGRFDEAEAALRRATEIDPDSANARIWLLVTQARRAKAAGDVLPALEKYFEVLTLDPKHHEALAETKKLANAQAKPGLLGRLFGSGDK